MPKHFNTYWKLFITTFLVSAFTFGGGYVIVPLMKKKFVEDLKWMEEQEMLNLIAIAQASPGAIAINTSILLGYRLLGVSGAIVTILGTVLPPFIIISVISSFYIAFRDNKYVNALLRGMQAGVAAVIINVIIDMIQGIIKKKKAVQIIVMICAFCATFFFKANVAVIIIICGAMGGISALISKRKGVTQK